MIKKTFLIFILLTFSISALNAQETIEIGTKHKIHSEILGEEREYWVSLPNGYDPQKKYPVFYALDGKRSFHYLSGIIKKFINDKKIPEMILVSVLSTDRVRDFTPTHKTTNEDGTENKWLKKSGGADNFLNFLQNELIPEIDRQYSTNNYKTLSGHSASGLIAVYTYIKASNLFNNFILIDPSFWWDDNVVTKMISEIPEPITKNIIFLTSAFHENEAEDNFITTSHINFEKTINKRNFKHLSFKRKYFENEEHVSSDLLSFYYGLTFIYQDYKEEQ